MTEQEYLSELKELNIDYKITFMPEDIYRTFYELAGIERKGLASIYEKGIQHFILGEFVCFPYENSELKIDGKEIKDFRNSTGYIEILKLYNQKEYDSKQLLKIMALGIANSDIPNDYLKEKAKEFVVKQ